MNILDILRKNSKEVDSEIEKFLPKKISEKWLNQNFGMSKCDVKAVNEFLAKPTWDLLERGGKRWRPLLMFLSCAAVG